MKDYSLTDLEQVMKESDHRMEMIYRKAERQAEEYKKVIYPPSPFEKMQLFLAGDKIIGDPASIDRLINEFDKPMRIKMDRGHSSDAMKYMGLRLISTPIVNRAMMIDAGAVA